MKGRQEIGAAGRVQAQGKKIFFDVFKDGGQLRMFILLKKRKMHTLE